MEQIKLQDMKMPISEIKYILGRMNKLVNRTQNISEIEDTYMHYV